ncbi:MAG: hypothetical protein APR63_01510 [Desulfuromonas sp. SDB]|nr:MAG: hypothetical protein APR63_01510 [Desulfuromonas sp. SDB]
MEQEHQHQEDEHQQSEQIVSDKPQQETESPSPHGEQENTEVEDQQGNQEANADKSSDPDNDDQELTGKFTHSDETTKWYALHIYSGSEKKVQKMIQEMKKSSTWGKFVNEIYAPIKRSSRVVRSSKSAKRVLKPKNLYPGYIFIKIEESQEAFRAISNLPNVIGFLGGDNPIPLTQQEEENLKSLMEEGDKIVKLTTPFVVSESVKIINGPFADFIGTVENVNEEKQRLRVIVTIFGRATPVEVDFVDAQPV